MEVDLPGPEPIQERAYVGLCLPDGGHPDLMARLGLGLGQILDHPFETPERGWSQCVEDAHAGIPHGGEGVADP
jgi:hypothetical protein